MTRSERDVLTTYEQEPMADGDVALLTDAGVILELEELADNWTPELCNTFAEGLSRGRVSTVTVIVARAGSDLRTTDFTMHRALREACAERGVDVGPVQAVPASR